MGLDASRLVVPLGERQRSNFLAFGLPNAMAWQARLAAARIVTDHRGSHLRFGFSLHHTEEEVERPA